MADRPRVGALDLLLTSDTVSKARDKTNKRCRRKRVEDQLEPVGESRR